MNKTTHSFRFVRTIGSALALTLTIATSNAIAGPADDVRMQTVKYGDLNLNSDEGVSAVYKRIHVAAQNVCSTSLPNILSLAASTKQCVASAEAGAVRKINASRLSAWYAQKTGKAQPVLVASN